MNNLKLLNRNYLIGIRQFSSNSGNKKFTKDHQWVELSDGNKVAKVGITDHARKQLKGVNSVHTPRVGEKYNSNDLLYVVSSDQYMAKFFNPINGTVTKINERIIDHPEIVHNDCENSDKGWIAVIETNAGTGDASKHFDNLLSKKEYDEMVNKLK